MAGEPKRKNPKSAKRTRRSAIKLAVNFVMCINCTKPTLPHIVCKNCGFYSGKQVGKQKVQVTKA